MSGIEVNKHLAGKLGSLGLSDCQLSSLDFVEILGTGTFGKVVLAKHKTTGKYFAVKILRKVDVIRLKQVEHVYNEKQILLSVNHPFIVNLYSTFNDAPNLYMLMEFASGGELFYHLRKAGRFQPDVARFFAAEIVLALEYLHSNDIVYRDLKPENILLSNSGHVKITDFGFAKKIEDRTWTLCGTPEYLAPEIIQSKGHGKAADWWAFGILVFEMLAGYPPFFDDNPFGIYEKILVGKVQFPSHFESNAKDLVRKLLTADRTRRLGNLKGGPSDIKKHRWFKTVNWTHVFEKQVAAPIVPKVSHDGDTGNFEKYDESPHSSNEVGSEQCKNLFKGF